MALLEMAVGENEELLWDRPFQLLLLANVLPPLGTALLSPVLDSLIEPFGASAANIGLLMSAYSAPAILMIPIIGVLADRYGRRPVILFGLLCFGTAGTAIALTTNFRVALLLRLLQGVGFAALTPIIITSLGDIYTGLKETTAQGFRFTGSGLTQMIFPLVAGALVTVAWQYPFYLHLIAFPIAAMIYVWFEEPADTHATGTDNRKIREQLEDLWTLVRQQRVLAMVIARGTPNVVWIGFLTYNSIIVVELMDGSPTQAGILAALGSLSYAASATQAGRITSVFESRLYPLLAMNGALAAGLSIVLIAGSVRVAYAGVVLMGSGFGILLSLYRSIVTDLATDALRGSLVSLAEAVGRLTTTLTPIGMSAGIAVAIPRFGFDRSIQLVGIGTGVATTVVGIVCLVLANTAPPVRSPE